MGVKSHILTLHLFSAFIIGLLENLGSCVDPVKVIQRIPNGLVIPGLQASLIKIMADNNVQVKSVDNFLSICRVFF